MYISNSYIAFTYRLIYVFLCAIGLLRHYTPHSLQDNIKMMSYFTIQTNLFCLILFLVLLQNTAREIKAHSTLNYRKKLKSLRGMALVSMIIVFLAYNFVLKNTDFSMAKGCPTTITINDIFVHYIVPIMTVIDWLFFQPKGDFEGLDPFLWLFLPITYYCMINIKTVFNACSYPYYFIDIDKLGLRTVLNNAMLFMIVCLIIGYIILLLDKMLSKKTI